MAQLTVGLDIGTSAVRAAELDVSSGRPALSTYGQVGLPPGAVVDGEIHDGTAVSEAIGRLWKNGNFSSSSVVVGIAGLRAITREIDLPFVPDEEVEGAVRFQSEEIIPFPPDKTILSSQVLADYTSPEGNRMRRVLVAAAHLDLVVGVVAAVERAGLTVDGVDLISSALVRATGDHTAVTEQPEAIVSVGAGLTVVVVHQQGRPQFVRTIGSGGNATTAAISAALDLPIADAETIKHRLGESSPQIRAAERSAQSSIGELVNEIRNSVQYFTSLPGRQPVSRIRVAGGGSHLHGLLPALESQIRLPILQLSPMDRLDTADIGLSSVQATQLGAVLATPIGLALPESNAAVKRFNLLPPEVVRRSHIKRIQERTVLVAAVVLILLAGLGAWRYLEVNNAENSVNALKTSITSLNTQIPKYSLVVAAERAYTNGKARRADVLNNSIDWPQALSSLIGITPPNLQVLSFVGTTGNGTSTGSSTASSGTASTLPSHATTTTSAAIGSVALDLIGPGPALTSPSAWIQAIAGSKLFANPVPTSVTTDPNGDVSFPTTISITPNASLAKNASLQ